MGSARPGPACEGRADAPSVTLPPTDRSRQARGTEVSDGSESLQSHARDSMDSSLHAQLERERANAHATKTELLAAQGQIRLLWGWLKHLRLAFHSILGSRRWRLGNRLIGTIGAPFGRPRNPPLLREVADTLRNFERWSDERELRPTAVFEPVAFPAAPDRPTSQTSPDPGRYDIVVLANIDWWERFQRPQQLALQFAKRGHRVFYVVASASVASDDARGFRCDDVAPGVFEVHLAGPKQASRSGAGATDRYSDVLDEDACNRFLESLDALNHEFSLSAPALVVQLPFWTPLALALRARWLAPLIYDCMDEWEGFPHIGAPQLDAEKELVRQADVVTATAATLERKWRSSAQHCALVRNGVDTALFEQHCRPNGLLVPDGRPVIGFYGGLAEWVDLDLVATAARARPHWRFVLIGDVFVEDLCGLDVLSNVELLGRRPYEEMPGFLYHFDVCMIPFRINELTHAVDPVKLYEFLSAGKPVVATALRELEPHRDVIALAGSSEEFVARLDEAVHERDAPLRRLRVARARANDWSERYTAFDRAIRDHAPSVSIVVVSYENEALTRSCIESVLAHTRHPNFELILVDNASTDTTPAMLRHYETRDERVRVLLNDENRGFAAANNQGLAVARGDVLVLLNNDTVVPPGWLGPLLQHLADPTIGLIGPTTNSVGNEARIDIDYTELSAMPGFASARRAEHAGQCFEIHMLAMFCVALRREVFESIGPLDEAFGIGLFEDDDYSRRIQAKGLRTCCAEDAFVHHVGQAAFAPLIESGEHQPIWDRNLAYFESKWGPWQPHRQERDR